VKVRQVQDSLKIVRCRPDPGVFRARRPASAAPRRGPAGQQRAAASPWF